MKHNQLRSVAHNIADSLASGIGLMIGVYGMDIFGEAAKNPKGYVTVDFLNGVVADGSVSASLAQAIRHYREALPGLCEREGVSIASFRKLMARYSSDALDKYVLITIEDENGKSSTDQYMGIPLSRVKVLDDLGRIRTRRRPEENGTA